MESTGRVLVVDGDETARQETVAVLRDAGFEVSARDSYAGGRGALDPALDAVVTEATLPDGDGLSLVADARDVAPDVVNVIFTAVEPADLDTVAQDGGYTEYVAKTEPDARDHLVALVERSVASRTQTAYPVPDDEDARLDALAEYDFDVPALQADLDTLTGIAARVFDVEIAGVGLLDRSRQRFASCYGADLDSVEREATICTHAMLEDPVTVVEDVEDDPRFAENELLKDSNLRFYASANVTDPHGHVLGTFCLYDTKPGTLSENERTILRLLADDAAVHIQLRGRARDEEVTDDD